MPITGIETAAATAPDLVRGRPAAPPGPRARRCRRRATARGSGVDPVARSVLISETASAPALGRRRATAAGSATLGVSLTISGFAVSGRSASEQRQRLVGLLADDQPRLDVRAGDVELDRRHLVALADPLDQGVANSSWLVAITETISGTGSSPSRGRSARGSPRAPCSGARSS